MCLLIFVDYNVFKNTNNPFKEVSIIFTSKKRKEYLLIKL